MDIPFWIWLVVAGIIFSAYMTIRTNKEEKEMELKQAEEEGEVFMSRIKEEREKRQMSSGAN